jgi:hypothetical protein
MKQPYRHRVNQREFLNLPGFHEGAYVMVYVEDTSERGIERCKHTGNAYNPDPRMLLQIADCDSHISLEFDISSAHRRMNSFRKIQTLIDALEAFKAGMAEESTLYKRRERELSEVGSAPRTESGPRSPESV